MSKDNTAQLNLGYTYDNLGRLSSVSNNGMAVANYSAYDKNHNLFTAYYPVAGVTTSYTYGEANQLKSLVNKKGNSTLSSYSYTYYLDGNPESKKEIPRFPVIRTPIIWMVIRKVKRRDLLGQTILTTDTERSNLRAHRRKPSPIFTINTLTGKQ